MTCFSWLHFTDLHRGMKEQHWLWPGVREIFFEDLKKLHDKCGPWDLVLFTGDLTQCGSSEDFQKVDEILQQLWTVFKKLGSVPKLLTVPGNHDLFRPDRKKPAVKLLRQWNTDPEVREDFWNEEYSENYRQVIKEAFTNYTTWWNKQPYKPEDVNPGILPGDLSVTIEKDTAKLGIVGLNTSFLQLTDGDYKGKLALHTLQFQKVCGSDGPAWAKQHHACLLLTHHPPVWLHPDSQKHLNTEITDHGRFVVHLCGHAHDTAYREIAEGGAETRRIWQGSSLFGLQYFGKQNEAQRLHGYMAGRIELEEKAGKLMFWPREARLQGGQRNIVPDQSVVLTDEQHTQPREFNLLQPYIGAGRTDEPESEKPAGSQIHDLEKRKLPPQLNKKIVEFLALILNLDDSDMQRAFIYKVGLDIRLQNRITFGRSPALFLQLLVTTVNKYGMLEDGRNALEAVVESTKDYVGPDRREYCDTLIRELRAASSLEEQQYQKRPPTERTQSPLPQQLDTPPHKFDVAIKRLRDSINDQETLQEINTLSIRLMEIGYEDTTEQDENHRAERNRIIHALNRMALRYTRQFFKELSCSDKMRTSTIIPDIPFVFIPEISPTFQGRTSELEWLESQFSQVTAKRGKFSASQSVLVYGDMGIGKSRLVNVFAQGLLKREAAYVVMRTFSDDIAPAQMIAQLAIDAFYQYEDLSSSPVSLEALINGLSALIRGKTSGVDSIGQEMQSDRVLWNLIGELALQHPLVVVLEDLHRDRPHMRHLFSTVAQQPLRAPLLIIGTTQTLQTEWLKLPQLKLNGIEKAAMRTLVDELCDPSDLKGDFYTRLYKCTDGNPYFTVTLIDYLKQKEILSVNESTNKWECKRNLSQLPRWTPDNLIEFANKQLEELQAKDKRAGEDLKQAAVIGRRFLFRLLQRIANYSDDERENFEHSLELMVAQGLLQREEPPKSLLDHEISFHFRSPIIQEAIYQWNPELHLKVAQFLEDLYPDQADQDKLRFWRAFHYQRGGEKHTAIVFLRNSIRDIAAKHQPFESIWLHEYLLQYTSDLDQDEQLNLNRDLAGFYSEVGRYEDAFNAYKRVHDIALANNKQVIVIKVKAEMGWLRVKQERFDDAQILFEEAIAPFKQTSHFSNILAVFKKPHSFPDDLVAFVYRLYGGLYLERLVIGTSEKRKDAECALEYTRKAGYYIEECNLSDPDRKRDKALILNNLGRLLLETEQYKEANTYFQHALDVAKEGATERHSLEAYLLNNQGVVAAAQKQFEPAKRFFRESLEMTNQEENIFLRTKSLLNLAEIYIETREYREVVHIANESLWYANLLGHRTYKFEAYSLLGKAHLALNQDDEAHSCYEYAQKLRPEDPVIIQILEQFNNLKGGKA